MGKKKSARLLDSAQIKGRTAQADELNKKRMQVKAELEQLMADYARLTGSKQVKRRQYKLGKAPNDWHK